MPTSLVRPEMIYPGKKYEAYCLKATESGPVVEYEPMSVYQMDGLQPRIDLRPGTEIPVHPEDEVDADASRATPKSSKICPKEPCEVTDLVAMEEAAVATMPSASTQHIPRENDNIQGDENEEWEPPQVDSAQHYLDDNFSNVMRSSALGSNVSSLFNTRAFNTTQNEQKVTLHWLLPYGKNSQLETLKDKHIADFPAPGDSTGAMLV